MSDEEYVQEPIPVGFTKPMELASEPPEQEKPTFDSSPEGLKEAASELVDAPPEPVEIRMNDAETGKPRPARETLTAEQAGRELARFRNSIADAKEAQSDAATAELIDHIQGNAQNPDLQPQAQQQVQPEQQQYQPEQTAEQYPPGVDVELAKELAERSPKFRQALQAEVQQIEAAKQTYSDVVRQNAQAATAALLISFPELQNVPAEQLRTALQVMASQNPQRASEAVAHIQQTSALVQQWQDAQTAQNEQSQRQYRQQFNDFARQEDAKAEKFLPGVDTKKLGEAAVSTLRNIGFSDQDVRRAYNGEATIHLRDHRVQVLLAKAALYDQAQAGLHNATRAPAPPVMRPGVSGARADEYSQSELSGLTNRLNQTGNLKDAARLLVARRSRG